MNSVSPVYTENEVEGERVIALDQPEYYPIIVLRVTFTDKDEVEISKASLTRFRFTESERKAIAAGADLVIGQPHHQAMMPISLQLAMPNEYPKEF